DVGALDFDAETLSYTVTVDADVEAVEVSAAAAVARSELRIHGMGGLDPAGARAAILLEGDRMVIPIEVTAENGFQNIYTITVVRTAEDPDDEDGDDGDGRGSRRNRGSGPSAVAVAAGTVQQTIMSSTGG